MKRDIAAGVCKRLLSFLDQYNIPYLFSGGSLLGIIREGDLIVDDTDIDLCTYVPYIPIIYSMKKQLLENELIITREIKGDKLLKSIKKGKNGKVYDVTKWIPKHPGALSILKGIGKDATNLYYKTGHSKKADYYLFQL